MEHKIKNHGTDLDPDWGHHKLELLQKVCEQIIEDHTNKDWSAIDELFKNTSTQQLKGFLSDLNKSFNKLGQEIN